MADNRPAPPRVVRLAGLTTSELPPATDSGQALAPFLTSILAEAVPFIDSAAPRDGGKSSWRPKGGSRRYPESAAPVQVLERVAKAPTTPSSSGTGAGTETETETWFCRHSVHADAAEKGSASWAEFEDCFRDRHAETEEAFTPTVTARRAAEWDCSGVAVSLPGGNWDRFTLKVEEMRHRIGRPLGDRVFPVLQMSCAAAATASPGKTPGEEFLIVSIPVSDFASSPQAGLSRAGTGGIVIGAYVSVERVRRVPAAGAGAGGDIEWLMATASDAKGVLPRWVQALAVPAQVAKDVPLFLAWIAGERASKAGAGAGAGAAAATSPAAPAPGANGAAAETAPAMT